MEPTATQRREADQFAPITIDVDAWLIKYNTRNVNGVIFSQDCFDDVNEVPLLDPMSKQPVGRVTLANNKEGVKATHIHTQEYMRETIKQCSLNNTCMIGTSIGNVVTAASLIHVVPTTDKVSWQEKS